MITNLKISYQVFLTLCYSTIAIKIVVVELKGYINIPFASNLTNHMFTEKAWPPANYTMFFLSYVVWCPKC